MTDPRTVLDTTMPVGNDAGAATIRDYLGRLLSDLWDEGEGFSGKRPFGNSGWEWELYAALVRAGHITGTFDQDGYVEDADTAAGRALVADAIKAMPTLLAEVQELRDDRARLTKGIQQAHHLLGNGYTIQPRTVLAELLRGAGEGR